jgi:hypothetical protein
VRAFVRNLPTNDGLVDIWQEPVWPCVTRFGQSGAADSPQIELNRVAHLDRIDAVDGLGAAVHADGSAGPIGEVEDDEARLLDPARL